MLKSDNNPSILLSQSIFGSIVPWKAIPVAQLEWRIERKPSIPPRGLTPESQLSSAALPTILGVVQCWSTRSP
jgi:hypothetical protein